MSKDLAIVLNNGSINSAVATALAAQRYRLIMLHVAAPAQGQESRQTSSRARVAFEQQVANFKPYREHVLELSFAAQLTSAGGPKRAIAEATEQPASRLNAPLLELLPMIAVASRFAAHYQAVALFLGLRVGPAADDLAQATEYAQILQELLQIPCGLSDFEVATPLLELDLWQVIDLGFQVSVPFERTWSCSGDGAESCWACRGCRSREAAFHQAGRPDPIRTAGRG